MARRASHPFGAGVAPDLTEAELKEVDDMCVRYFCEGLGASFKADSEHNLLGTKDTCCNYFEPLGKVVLSDKVQNMLGLDTTLAWKMDEFIDPSKTNWEPKVATICGKFNTSAPPDEDGKPTGGDAWKNTFGIWLKERYWGYSDWRDDPSEYTARRAPPARACAREPPPDATPSPRAPAAVYPRRPLGLPLRLHHHHRRRQAYDHG